MLEKDNNLSSVDKEPTTCRGHGAGSFVGFSFGSLWLEVTRA